ncbi:precorrin-4 C(11)-methyltransferase [Geothermobacter hydrogeniphilus]|uniref:Precorrin-4 C(11)-methyltransferase n=1 Tax=Geothermobacter hydrogeniphilus TaxID=1969733 RepID=A0A1X0Y576_9BACT|nr:precorrin-4 C(11)-methyltransferase [Geothermobacter hydrogeniphilus]ORJ60279.1 precorrin-4 C(11)-methyltransferase [Geothermobacter hydrogeniphilus]
MSECHPILFVGAGPGDPELITVKGLKALRRAEVVVHAGSLVNPALLSECPAGCEIHDSAPLTLQQTHTLLVAGARAGKRVVRLHTGDPALYGAIQEQMELLDAEGLDYRVVPGVTAAFAAAAALKQELTLPEISQTLVLSRAAGRTPVPEAEKLSRLAANGGTLCLYLSVGMMDKVVAALLAGGVFTARTPAAVVYRASWPDEKIVSGTLADITGKVAEAGIRRQALILVGEALGARERGVEKKSKLYDAQFAHGYRTPKGGEGRKAKG